MTCLTRYILLPLAVAAGLVCGAVAADAQTSVPGSLDPSFGSGGKVTTSFGGATAVANAVALQPDGKVVVVGEAWSTSSQSSGDFAIARYNTDGSLDTTFGVNGRVTTDFAGAEDGANAVAIQPDGKIVVAGFASGSPGGGAVVRYLANGQLDTTFGSGAGKVLQACGLLSADSVAIQPDGRIVVGGIYFNDDVLQFSTALASHNADGTLDSTFNPFFIAGVLHFGCNNDSDPLEAGTTVRARLTPDGRILVGATVGFASGQTLWLYQSNGKPDATFNMGAPLMVPAGVSVILADVAIQSDGRVLPLGTESPGSGGCNDFALGRLNLDGSVDTTFGSGGWTDVAIPFGRAPCSALAPDLLATGLQVDSLNRPFVVGQITAGDAGDFVLARFDVTGNLDRAFGGGVGYVRTDFFGLADQANGVALQTDGSIVVVGFASVSASQKEFALARYIGGDGTPPSITTQPQSQTVAPSQPFSLSVVNTGTAPLSYQWYVGATGDTSHSLPSSGPTYSSIGTVTLSFWVRVSNSAGNADSTTATVTVTSSAPTIVTDPHGESIAPGGAAFASVVATGAGALAYQWFTGLSGNTLSPIPGATSASLTLTPANTVSIWVRVFSVSGNTDSLAATITVVARGRTTLVDFDRDAKADLAVFRPSTGEWFVRQSHSGFSYSDSLSFQWGESGDTPLAGDFDGDGKTDVAVYRPSNGTWYIRYSSDAYSYSTWTTYQWGVPGDLPLVADFDGDGKTDLAVYRPSTGEWFIRYSSSDYSYATAASFQWGIPGDVPLAADFDGDGRADLVVYRPSTGEWFIRFSSSNYSFANWVTYQWGLPGDVPLIADFDGDGKADLAVYRPSTGEWFVRLSSSSYSFSNWVTYQWGLPGDIPIIADFDGDGRADLSVYRPSTGEWYIRFSSSNYSYANWIVYQWGVPGDIPLFRR